MKRAPRSRQRHDLYAKYHDYDSEISDLLGECGFISKNSANLEAAKKFLAFVVSPEGCEILKRTGGASGPFLVKGCDLENAAPAVSDMLPFFDSGNNSPALEFLSPIKGPSLAQITVSVGSGIMTAEEGAKLYDEDVRKQAQQLGLAGW